MRSLGHDTDTVVDEALTGAGDPEVWEAAQREERFLVTQDLDFADVRKFTPGTHHGILLVRLASPSRLRLEAYLRELLATEDFGSWAGGLVVATDAKVRVRRPPH